MPDKVCPECGLELSNEDNGSTVDLIRYEITGYRGRILEDGRLEVWGDKSFPESGDMDSIQCQRCGADVSNLVTGEEIWY